MSCLKERTQGFGAQQLKRVEKLTRLARRLTAASGKLKLSEHWFELSEGTQFRSVAAFGGGFSLVSVNTLP